ncbi:MAG: AmmeMemoRadiSam system protein A [Planctomycetota bacterium]|jgi:AmmeMemoRadiSam system protein A
MLSDSSKDILKNIVCKGIEEALSGNSYMPEENETEDLNLLCGCFVTLKTHGQLRGCLGRFTSDEPIYKTVAIMTQQSALEDPRFASNRLTTDEINDITYDISILSPLEPCTDPESIELGKHGIYVKQGFNTGCFLPQVATETGWSIEEFWGYCCTHKAGLDYRAWKSRSVERYTFTAEVIEGEYESA